MNAIDPENPKQTNTPVETPTDRARRQELLARLRSAGQKMDEEQLRRAISAVETLLEQKGEGKR